MDLMASVLLERETVEGEACEALLNNEWDEYLSHEDEINARKEAEEAAARARDEQLANPNWRDAAVEPGDQNANGPYRPAAQDADLSDIPTQAQVDAEIVREDVMDSTPEAPAPAGEDPYATSTADQPTDSASADKESDDPKGTNE